MLPATPATTDLISDLPSDLQVLIVSKLVSTKEAARTSALSKQWRYLWLSLPHLSFGESLGFSDDRQSFCAATWMCAVLRILWQRHRYSPSAGPIPSLYLSTKLTETLDSLLYVFLPTILSTGHGVERLSLCNDLYGPRSDFTISDEIFTCSPSLEALMVQHCTIQLPRDWDCFASRNLATSTNLRSLSLSNVSILDSNLDLLMIPLLGSLQKLSLFNVEELETLMLRSAPKLSDLSLLDASWLRMICLAGAPLLTDFAFDFTHLVQGDDDDDDEEGKERTSLVDLLMGLGSVERLYLVYDEGETPFDVRRIQVPQCLPPDRLLINLSQLHMTLSLADAALVLILSCLLCSSPNLRELRIEDDQYGFASISEGEASLIRDSGRRNEYQGASSIPFHL